MYFQIVFPQLKSKGKKHIGILLENVYTAANHHSRYQELKGNDQNVKHFLESANKCLPEDEKYSFHVMGYDPLFGKYFSILAYNNFLALGFAIITFRRRKPLFAV